MKEQKGITLIALIITIIVMLILVAVTINVALNGGIFDKAKDAKEQTSFEAERERLINYALGEYNATNGTTDLSAIKTELEKDTNAWKEISLSGTGANQILIVKGKESGEKYQIDINGNVSKFVEKESVTGKIYGDVQAAYNFTYEFIEEMLEEMDNDNSDITAQDLEAFFGFSSIDGFLEYYELLGIDIQTYSNNNSGSVVLYCINDDNLEEFAGSFENISSLEEMQDVIISLEGNLEELDIEEGEPSYMITDDGDVYSLGMFFLRL